mmetsp:Transcript_37072/g.86994  ORF Transcript_37072/g.86994 Transcript_37072/m.86994 type:complete len:175 (-) Transcript_37072:132-656(-)
MSVPRLVLLSTLALAAGKRAGSSQGFHRGQLEATVSEQALEAKPVTYVVKSNWMHGVFAGEYVEAGRRNGKPKYKQRDGPCVMFHEGYELKLPYGEGAPGWKIGFEEVPAKLKEYSTLRLYKKGSVKDDVPPEGTWFFQGHRRWLKPDPLFERVSKRTSEYLDIADARVKRKVD